MAQNRDTARAVLIVECNGLLNLSMIKLVEAAGFVAVSANSADEAVPVLESRADIALVITNVKMDSGMSGIDLVHHVDKHWPAIKLIVVSGKPGISENDLPSKCLFFAKPYHDEEIVFEIRARMGS
jgi:DNA-binding NtrC family response regulator